MATLGPSEIGLGNVANLSPDNLGISIATQAAIDSLQAMIDSLQSEAGSFTFDFTTGTQGWDQSQFAGVQTITTDNDQLVVTQTATAPNATVNWEGILNQNLGIDLIPGDTYTLDVDVDSLQNTWRLVTTFSQAVDFIDLEEGVNRLTFVYGLHNQGQSTENSQNNLLYPAISQTGSPVIGDFIRINGITLFAGDGSGTENGADVQALIDELEARIEALEPVDSALHRIDFETDGDAEGWDGFLFGSNQTINVADGKLAIQFTAGTEVSVDSRNINFNFIDGTEYELVVTVSEVTGSSWRMQDRFSASVASQDMTVGENVMRFTRTEINGQFPTIRAFTAGGGQIGDSISIESIVIRTPVDAGPGSAASFDPSLPYTWIGEGAENNLTGVILDSQRGVIIGNGALGTGRNPVVVGDDARIDHTTYYGSNVGIHGAARVSDLQSAVFGHQARSGGWRGTASGDLAHALGQSSTAVGAGAVSLATHGQAVGRGAFVPDQSQLRSVGTVLANRSLYLENTWGHRFSTPYSGIGISGDLRDPTIVVVEYHSADAFDSRYPFWDATEDYPEPVNFSNGPRIVQHDGNAYKSIAGSGPGTQVVEPGVTADWESTWVFMHPVVTLQDSPNDPNAGPPSEFNMNAGHGRLIAGLPTGTGVGGTAGLSVADGVNRGENRKQRVTEALYVDSDPGNANTYMCFRKTDGTEHRINVEADGTLKAIPRNELNLNYLSDLN